MGVLKFLAPRNADVWERALRPFGSTPSMWASISLDPGASHIEVLKWLVYAGVFALAACSDAHRAEDVDWVARGIERLKVLEGPEETDYLMREGPLSILKGTVES
jgi:hypothetical protein